MSLRHSRIGWGLCLIIMCHHLTAGELSVRLHTRHHATDQDAFAVLDVPTDVLKQLADADLSQAQWQMFLAVYTGPVASSTPHNMPPVAGTYHVRRDRLEWKPRFSLQPGMSYTVMFDTAHLPVDTTLPKETLIKSFTLPKTPLKSNTVVEAVYPNADILPENLLKFYIHFSESMAAAQAYQHITLIDAEGQAVDLPFLEIEQELWDPGQRRLTLLLDPGRIKRDLKPNLEEGLPLNAGGSYTLSIHKEWPDAQGVALKAAFKKSFQVAPFDQTPPNPGHWILTLPKAGTTAPLGITFREPLDHALAMRCITVYDARQQAIEGVIHLTDHDTVWHFTPTKPWHPGPGTLRINTILEDLAGNSVGRLFEVDLAKNPSPQSIPDVATLNFSIR